MKKILTLIFLHFFVIAVKAQTTRGRIDGKVIDEQTKQPVDYATIGIYKQGAASPFNGISTDPKGNFTLNNLPEGDYKLVVDFVGYQRTTVDHVVITKNKNAVVLNNIILKSAQHQLKDVVITARAPVVENKIDRIVYNAENDVTAQGGVALDILKKVPMISVDIDGNVELQGNSNVRFLINGKPSSIFGANLTDALQAIPASQIKSIEVITNPGAKYDATGTGGIVNIILKESRIQGINGSVNLSAGTRLENGSFNLNVRRGKFGAGAYFAGNEQLSTTTNSTNSRQSYSSTRDTITNLLQQGHSTTKRHGYQTGFHFQWDITKKDNLTGSIGYNNFGSNSNGFSNQQQDEINTAGNMLSNVISQRISNNQSNNHGVDWSLAYKKTFKKEGQELDILYNSSRNNNTSKFLQNQVYPNGDYPTSGTASTNPGTDHETDISIDYTQPVTKTVTIETGAKAVIENLNNNVNTDTLLNDGSFIPDANQTYGFNYERDIYAAYLASSFSLFKFIDGKAGLRYEHTSTSEDYGDTEIPSYNTLAPSFVLSHRMSETGALRFSYSYRIQRPSYGDLNPFYNISDPHNISTGNPDLKPESGHNYELSFNNSFNGGAHMFVSAFYHHNTDDLQSLTTFYDVLDINGVDYSDVSLTKRYNLGTQTQEGVNFFGALPIKEKLNLRTNLMVAERSDSNPGLQTVSGVYYRANLNVSYNFGNNLVAEVFGNYNSSQKNIQGQRPSFAFYNIAMRKQFLNKKLSVGITAADPFNNYINQKSTTYASNFYQTNYREVPYRTFGISVNYKFGKLEFKKVEDKDKDSEDNTPKPIEN
ncbi:MAG TPA: outer membrane beta-barrel family protein [Mucilaginibacter sp.]|jgi:outer membrane receptor protein involved in Fe transport